MASFPKTKRLLTSAEFKNTLDGSGLKVVCHDFVIVASTATRARHARLGLVVSGKVGNSVIRNRIKRSVRALFRDDLSELPLLAGRDLVVIARPSLVGKDGRVNLKIQQSLQNCVDRLIRKLSA